ncbi:MAG: N-formylglutamate amidohydrolase [Planctomycetota bacterium]|nr:N-formylglutamate amidohydrolase [Planctomycetota bacterium]
MRPVPALITSPATLPLVAAAIHDGHEVRDDLLERLGLDGAGRLREEDPFTGVWTEVAPTRVVGLRSRFEVDLNRPRGSAVYRKPEDAWGLDLWRGDLPAEQVERSLGSYDEFYGQVKELFGAMERRFGRFVVLDLHSYNHRRAGPDEEPSDPQANPEVNVGTGTLDRARWAPVVDRFIDDLRRFDYLGRHLDVRENVKFQGGEFCRWLHESFPESACGVAVEFKKFFMDEWTGEPFEEHVEAIGRALTSTVPGLLEGIRQL